MNASTAPRRPFRIDVPQAELDDVRERLDRVRWPNVVDEDDATHGVPVSFLRRLVEHWRTGYDWRAHEAELNRLGHAVRRVRGLDVHHVHQRADGDTGVPVILLHGWPDSFYRYHLVMPRLIAAGHDVVVPSIPGYLFSEQPAAAISVEEVAEVVHELMTDLGYDRYVAHGGDWGSAVAEQLAIAHHDAVVALHLTDVPYHHLFGVDRSALADVEKAFIDAAESWAATASYLSVQSYHPTTLSYGLSDSPAGLAAWLVDKYRAWTDREPDLDQVITHVSLYWHTNCIRSSMRLYSEGLGEWDEPADPSSIGASPARPLAVPTAFAVFPREIVVPPRAFAERFFTVQRYTLLPRGGHFGALEEPDLLADDLLAFLATLPG